MSERRLRPLIVPIFIPNMGCPHMCVFCRQDTITSQSARTIDRKYVEDVLETAVRSKGFDRGRRREVAFFGGTFTRLSLKRMQELLSAVAPYLARGMFDAIRVSTRPDALDDERMEMMKHYGVRIVELGAQSMDNAVLAACERGHTAEHTVRAVHVLRGNGFSVGMQLMPGLPGDSRTGFASTVTKTIQLHPDMVRLYPALVISGTKLARWYSEGRYAPLDLEEAVEICVDSCARLEAEEIPVIRIGLMSTPSLLEQGRIVAGPWHTAFGYLVRSAMHMKIIERELPERGRASRIRILVPEREIPLVRGYRNRGLSRIRSRTGANDVRIEADDSIPGGRVRVESE